MNQTAYASRLMVTQEIRKIAGGAGVGGGGDTVSAPLKHLPLLLTTDFGFVLAPEDESQSG